MSTDRPTRRAALLALLERGPVASQAELVHELARRGFDATQGTLSRDLKAIGAVKGPAGYVVPGDGPQAQDDTARLAQALRDWVTELVPAGQLVVLRTPPACASPLAMALDAAPPAGLVATLAGDDTVLCVSAGERDARRLVRELEQHLHLPHTRRRA